MPGSIRMVCTALFVVAGVAAGWRPAPARAQTPTVGPRRNPALESALATRGISVECRWALAGRPAAGQPPYRDPSTGAPLALSDTVAFDLTGVTGVLVSGSPAGSSVALRLSMLGAQRLLRTTTAHQGQRIAVLINRRVVSVALVGGPLSGMLPVATGLPADQADALAGRIRSGITP